MSTASAAKKLVNRMGILLRIWLSETPDDIRGSRSVTAKMTVENRWRQSPFTESYLILERF
jgi:hypothetical protein